MESYIIIYTCSAKYTANFQNNHTVYINLTRIPAKMTWIEATLEISLNVEGSQDCYPVPTIKPGLP